MKLTLKFIAHAFVVAHKLPTSTSHSHHVIGVPRPYPFSTTLLYLCIILSVNQRTKMGKAWECGCRVLINVYSVELGLQQILFSRPIGLLPVCKNGGRWPGSIYHMSYVNVYLDRQKVRAHRRKNMFAHSFCMTMQWQLY